MDTSAETEAPTPPAPAPTQPQTSTSNKSSERNRPWTATRTSTYRTMPPEATPVWLGESPVDGHAYIYVSDDATGSDTGLARKRRLAE